MALLAVGIERRWRSSGSVVGRGGGGHCSGYRRDESIYVAGAAGWGGVVGSSGFGNVAISIFSVGVFCSLCRNLDIYI